MKPPVDAPTSIAPRPRDVDPEGVERVCELVAAARDVLRGALDLERRLLLELLARLRHPRHEPREDERLRLCPALREPSLDEEHVGALLHRDKANRVARRRQCPNGS